MIEAALRGGRSWPPALEALYERQSGPIRRAAAARTTMICGVLFIGASSLDAFAGLAMTGLPWRAAVLALSAVCAVLLRRLSVTSRLLHAEISLIALPQVAGMIVTQSIGEFAGHWADRYMLASVFSVSAFVATTPLARRTAHYLCAASVLAYPIVPGLMPYALPLRGNLDLPVFAAGVMATSLFIALRNERARRAGFLMRRRHEIAAAEMGLMNAELLRLSTIDPLTGLRNRRAFTQALQAQWQCRRQALALVIFDVDWFKSFNDSAGHAAGDVALKAVACAAERAIRGGVDLAARIGGEEFAVIMPGVDQIQAVTLAERLRGEVAALHLPHPGRPGNRLSISLGVACCQPEERPRRSPDELFRDADRALYSAKREGRDRVVLAVVAGRGEELGGPSRSPQTPRHQCEVSTAASSQE